MNELKLIAKSRGIKIRKSMSEDRVLSDLNAPEPVKESENNFDDTKSRKNEDDDADEIDEILKTNMPDPTKINKTIRKKRKENYDD